ncbi:MAG: response regulator, partial [Candidatus Eisenbacteria bacterium]
MGERHRILFVDDEQSMLDGLRDLLRRQRHAWDMVFAPGGEAAMEEVRRAPFDVVISDMRMPGMDGAALLEKMKAECPGAIRIVLSGHAEREAVIRSLPVAQQFLGKPCDGETLRTVIDRACKLRAFLAGDNIRVLVGSLERLPSLPSVYWDLTRALSNANSSTDEIAAVVEQDPAMSAKVLQLVNSAYFGLSHRIASIGQAVAYLGVELLKALLLTAHVFGAGEKLKTIPGFSLEHLQRDALFTGRLARQMLPDPKLAEEAFTAGLLREVGVLALAGGQGEGFAAVLGRVRETGEPVDLVEKEVLGANHAEIGAYLLGAWGLPLSIVEAVAYHHKPSLSTSYSFDVLAAVHLAGVLADEHLGADGAGSCGHRLDDEYIQQ